MSQYPTPTGLTPGRPGGIARNRSIAVPGAQTDLPGGIVAPMEPLPNVSAEAARIGQLMDAFGASVQAAIGLGNFAERQRIVSEREEAKRQELERQREILGRKAQAALAEHAAYWETSQKAEAERILVDFEKQNTSEDALGALMRRMEPGEDPAVFARRVFEEATAPDGPYGHLDKAGREHLVAKGAAAFDNRIAQRLARDQAAAVSAGLDDAAIVLAGSTSAEEMQRAWKSVNEDSMVIRRVPSVHDRIARVILPALKGADEAKIGMLEGLVGDPRYKVAFDRARMEAAESQADAEKGRVANERQAIFAYEKAGEPYSVLRDRVAKSGMDPEQKQSLEAAIFSRAKEREEGTFERAIALGLYEDAAAVESEWRRRVALPIDDPQRMEASTHDRTLGILPKANEVNEIQADVVRNLRGENVLLTDHHADALAKAIQASGSIDTNNRIADPTALAAQLHQAGIVPPQVKQIIDRGLSDPAGPDMGRSAATLLALENSPVLAEIVSQAKDADRWKIEWSMDRARSGWFATPEQAAKAAQDYKSQAQTESQKPAKIERITRFENEYNKGDKKNGPKSSDVDSAAIVESLHPGTTPWIDAMDMVSQELSVAYARHASAQRPDAKARAIQDATAVAQRKLVETSWNGQRRVGLSYDEREGPSAGVVMPHKWTVLDEEDAAKALDTAGFGDKKNRIIGFRAVTNRAWKPSEPQSRRVGLAFETDLGDILTDDRGDAILFFPTLRTDFQTELELKKRPKQSTPVWSASIAGAVQ